MILAEGSVTDRPLPRTFAAIAARGFSGEMVVRSGNREFRVAWHDGAVVGATSPHPADGAAKIAVTLGLLNSTQAGEVGRVIVANPGCDEVEVVAQIARLSSEIVGRLARRLAATRAARVFSVDQGTFQLLGTQPHWGTVAPIDPRWIMYSGVRMHYAVDRLHREVTSLATAIRLRPDVDLTSFGFGEAEADVLARLRAGNLVLEPAPLGLDPRVVQAVALVLLAVGDAEPIAQASPAAPRTVTPRATTPPRSNPALKLPPLQPRRRTTTHRRARIADPTRIQQIIAERLAALDGGADHYALLGVTPESGPEEVRTAYFGLARHLHPDRLSAAGITDERGDAHRVFARINEAFAVLSTPDRRAAYDRERRAGGTQVVQAQAAEVDSKVRRALDGEQAYRRGEALLRRQQFPEALLEFKTAAELAPDESDHHAMLGWVTYVAAADRTAALPLARSHLRQALERNDRSLLAHLSLGRIARMEGADGEALTHLRTALEISPRNTDAAAELRAVEARRAKASDSRSGLGLFGRKKP